MSTTETRLPAQSVEPLSDIEIDVWNEEFGGLSPEARIEVAHQRLGERVIAASTFGPTAPVLLKPLSEVASDVPVVTVRHHHETLETLRLIDWYSEELGLDLRLYDAPPLPIPPAGSPAFREFQQQVKVEPFQRALRELQPHAFLSGRMRWQSEGRAELPFVERKGAVVAINAVVDVSREAVEDFFAETGWPRDEHYFDPTKGPDQKLECGLNTADYTLTAGEEEQHV